MLENYFSLLFNDNFKEFSALENSLVINPFGYGFKLLICVCCIIYLSLFLASFYNSIKDDFVFDFPVKEFIILFSIMILGMFLMISSNHMLLTHIAIEIQSLCFYVFLAMRKTSNLSIEASIKYYIYSITSTVIFLLGSSLLYSLYGTLNFSELSILLVDSEFNVTLAISISLLFITVLFKLAIFPFHSRIPAVHEGSPLIITLFFATIAKIPFVYLLVKFVIIFKPVAWYFVPQLQFLSIISILYGSIVALTQTKLKKLLAYSAISHMGFIVLGISYGTIDGISAGIFYFIIYLFLTFSIFSILLYYRYLRNNEIVELDKTVDLIRLYKTNPILAFILSSFLLSMAGIPPFIGFFSKWYVFHVLASTFNYSILVIIIFSNSYASLSHIRLIRNAFFNKDTTVYGDFLISNLYPLAFFIVVCGSINCLFFLFHPTLFYLIKILVMSLF